LKAWFWCPNCERAFNGDVTTEGDLPAFTVIGFYRTSCPFCDVETSSCDARISSRCVMTWLAMKSFAKRSYGVELPVNPVHGERYSLPAG